MISTTNHAFLSPSKSYWLRYDEEKLIKTYQNSKKRERGTQIHELAERHIRLGIPGGDGKTGFDAFVNDALEYVMYPEVRLFYSKYAFGTADAIGFDGITLRIHDLKTGDHRAKMEQLFVYAALFCLQEQISPETIKIQLRLYYPTKTTYSSPNPTEIKDIMDKIVYFSDILKEEDERVRGLF